MSKKGQIVEIPASSPLYSKELPAFHSKKDELTWKSAPKAYSLFDGFLVGDHPGVEQFRIGQRKGINVGGKKQPLYVIAMDEAENRLFVGAGDQHPGLWTDVIRLNADSELFKDINASEDELENGVEVRVELGDSDRPLHAKLYRWEEKYFLEFQQKISVLAAEQIKNIRVIK